MSLLPQAILAPAAPIGILDKETGYVIIEQNWWLFLYNLSLNVLGVGAGGPTGSTGLPATALIELSGVDADASDADAIVLRQPIANLNALTGILTETETDAFALRQPLLNALLLAQEATLPDPAPVAQPVKAVTVGASPFSYTMPFSGQVAITGGTVSAIDIIRQSTTVSTGLTVGLIPASRGDIVRMTYTVVPTFTFLPT